MNSGGILPQDNFGHLLDKKMGLRFVQQVGKYHNSYFALGLILANMER